MSCCFGFDRGCVSAKVIFGELGVPCLLLLYFGQPWRKFAGHARVAFGDEWVAYLTKHMQKYLKVKKDKVQDSISLCHATHIRCLGDWSAGENPCDDLRKGRGCCVTHCEWHAAGDHGDWPRLSDHMSHVFTRKVSIGGCVNKQHALQYRIS